MEREIREIELPGGQRALARVTVVDQAELPAADGGAFSDVGAADRLAAWSAQLNRLIAGVGSAVHDAARRTAPQEVTATFGVELVAKPGKAVAVVFADAEATASISVTLTWRPGETRHGENAPNATANATTPTATPAPQAAP